MYWYKYRGRCKIEEIVARIFSFPCIFLSFFSPRFCPCHDNILSRPYGRSIGFEFGKRDNFTAPIQRSCLYRRGSVYIYMRVYVCACVRRVRFDVALKAFLFFLWRVTMAHTSGRIARVLGRSARAWFTMDRDGTSNWTAF